jgi:hypothetical protein
MDEGQKYRGASPRLSNNKELARHLRPRSNQSYRFGLWAVAVLHKEPPSTASYTPVNRTVITLLIRRRRTVLIYFRRQLLIRLCHTATLLLQRMGIGPNCTPVLPTPGGRFFVFSPTTDGEEYQSQANGLLKEPVLGRFGSTAESAGKESRTAVKQANVAAFPWTSTLKL